MIGFLPQPAAVRRPIYSVTGQKLCYLVSGPDGEWIQDLDGRKRARITKWTAALEATQSVAGTVMLDASEIYED